MKNKQKRHVAYARRYAQLRIDDMGVDLNVWSNHKLGFTSVQEGIERFESRTSKKIRQWNFKTDKPLVTTDRVLDIEYFTHFEILNYNFEKWNQIRIWTNFEFCSEVTIFRESISIHPQRFRIRYSKWQELVTRQYTVEGDSELEELEQSRRNWMKFRKYAHEITKQLQGTKVIYLNDHKYQNEEDLFYQGKSFEEGIDKLTDIIDPIELELFELYPNDILAMNTWYYDEL